MADSVLLPKNVRPKKYTLVLEPNLESFKFLGQVTIDLDVVEPTKTITFHTDELEITKAEVQSEGNKFDNLPVKYNKSATTAEVDLGENELKEGSAILYLEFTGTHNDNMVGFYSKLNSCVEQYGDATWHFFAIDAIDARKALPCWDEPAVKAVFDVTLIVPQGLTGLSNMPPVSTTPRDDGSSAIRFAESPIMSTYLLAFVVGQLEKVSGTTKEGVEVNVYTTPGKKEQGQFSCDVAVKILSFFTEYFGIAYPLPKADLVAIPDFASGAMENWGLITFRETALLVDGPNASAATRQRVAEVVSHELAHQWFGNLVTMQWWSDLWLNEGFATWVGSLGVDSTFPEWDVWTQFVSNEMGPALITDALLSSHPIQVPISDPKEINQVFDALSYEKGACVIRQLVAAVGAASFKLGLNAYLDTHKYGNTVTNDLWAAIGEASGKPVKQMMDSWTAQMGYPLITISPASDGVAGLHLRQTRFLSAGPPSAENDSQLWWVPVTAAACTPGGVPESLPVSTLSEKEADFAELVVPEGGWLKLNAGQTGIYRVNYTPDMWQALARAVTSLELPPTDRLGVLMDAFALAKAGVLRTSQALELATAFANETEYTVWSQLSADLGALESLLSATEHLPLLEAVGSELYLPIASKVGWEPQEGESHLVAMLRPMVLQKLGTYQHALTIAECNIRFKFLLADLKLVSPDLRKFVMAMAVKYGGREEYEGVKRLFKEAPTQDLKIQCLTAMGQTRDAELVKEYLEFGLDSDNVKAQDLLYVFASLAGNKHGRDIQWAFVKERWETIYGRYQQAHGLIQYVACIPLRGFASEEAAADAEDFFAANPVPEASMEIARTLEAVRSRAAWLKRDLPDIVDWLKKKTAAA
eukprot:jgi/Mesen1/5954/ME000301S05083